MQIFKILFVAYFFPIIFQDWRLDTTHEAWKSHSR